jgi:hypothetical protein
LPELPAIFPTSCATDFFRHRLSHRSTNEQNAISTGDYSSNSSNYLGKETNFINKSTLTLTENNAKSTRRKKEEKRPSPQTSKHIRLSSQCQIKKDRKDIKFTQCGCLSTLLGED